MNSKKILILCISLAITMTDACVDRITINVPNRNLPLVVDGAITTEPGPYKIKLSVANKVGGSFISFEPFFAKEVTLFDDVGNSEILAPNQDAVYQTDKFQGELGKGYFLRIETNTGKVYESIPEILKPAGTVDSVYYEFESHQPDNAPTKYGFRIFADFSGYEGSVNLFRWKFFGTYYVITHPEMLPEPPPCTGFVFDRFKRKFVQIDTCTCCKCWPSFVEEFPLLSDNSLSSTGQFKRIEVGYVPVGYWTFFDKTMVVVKQLSISQLEFDYWKSIRQQMIGGADLFQPTTGKNKSNIFLKGGTEEVLGYFSVAAVSKKIITLRELSLPKGYHDIVDTLDMPIKASCLDAFRHSVNKPPYYWTWD